MSGADASCRIEVMVLIHRIEDQGRKVGQWSTKHIGNRHLAAFLHWASTRRRLFQVWICKI